MDWLAGQLLPIAYWDDFIVGADASLKVTNKAWTKPAPTLAVSHHCCRRCHRDGPMPIAAPCKAQPRGAGPRFAGAISRFHPGRCSPLSHTSPVSTPSISNATANLAPTFYLTDLGVLRLAHVVITAVLGNTWSRASVLPGWSTLSRVSLASILQSSSRVAFECAKRSRRSCQP